MIKKIEALAESIAICNEYFIPESEAYRLRNPGLIKAHSIADLAAANNDCIRIFDTAQGGWRALSEKLNKLCKHEKVSLDELLQSMSIRTDTAVDFLQRSLNDESISEQTRLSYFLG